MSFDLAPINSIPPMTEHQLVHTLLSMEAPFVVQMHFNDGNHATRGVDLMGMRNIIGDELFTAYVGMHRTMRAMRRTH